MVDSDAGREKVNREGRCRVCGVAGRLAPAGFLTRAHLVAKGRGGDDIDANLVPLCGSGTTGCHGAFDNAANYATWPAAFARTADEVMRILWRRLTPEEHSYVIEKEGQAWAERRFRLT